MVERNGTDKLHSLRGSIDRSALLTVRDIIEREEPLAAPTLDGYLNPTVLEVSLGDGRRSADSARIDVQWTTRADYKFHYTDTDGVNFRWDSHPHGGDYISVPGLEYYHPPPDAIPIQTISKSPASSSLSKHSSLVLFSNSGVLPIMQTPTTR
nr:hypothetical protein [Haloarcula sp. K1]